MKNALYHTLQSYNQAIITALSADITATQAKKFLYQIREKHYVRYDIFQGTCELLLCDYFAYLLVDMRTDLVKALLCDQKKLACISANEDEGEKKTRVYVDSAEDIAACRALLSKLYQAVRAATAAYQKELGSVAAEASFEPDIEPAEAPQPQAAAAFDHFVPDNNVPLSCMYPAEYMVIDIETTGLDTDTDEIIEIAAIHVRDHQAVATFSQLVRPILPISDKIVSITAITNEMVADAPTVSEVFPLFLDFIGDRCLVGHNIVGFDYPFCNRVCNEVCGEPLKNITLDTLSMAKSSLHQPRYNLSAVAATLGITVSTAHRALADCETTMQCFERLCSHDSADVNLDVDIPPTDTAPEPRKTSTRTNTAFAKYAAIPKAKDIAPTVTLFDAAHPLFEKNCVITGDFTNLTREQAMQSIVNCGGFCADSVTRKTDMLIIGGVANPEKKTGKQKKAEQYMQAGQAISILSENEFFALLGEPRL